MLWDIIRDFFVQYIWGGTNSAGSNFFNPFLGIGYNLSTNDESIGLQGLSFYLPIKGIDDQISVVVEGISFADWLSTTSTIIVLILMCIFLYCFIRWAFRLTAGLFQGR